MNSARERAVEAGARAICADYDESEELARDVANTVIRAAFPAWADELAAQIEGSLDTITHDERLETADLAALRDRDHKIARALRARIQQMAEAEHE